MAGIKHRFPLFRYQESSDESPVPVIETGLGSPVLCSPKLDSGEVHVWRARLDLDAASVAALARILSTDELQRAMRFRRALDCHHFVAARAILRLILGSYLYVEPARIVFTRSPFGKPAVRLPKEGGPLHFNLSHSHGLTLYAISRDFEVGIDIEHIQPRLASLHLAQQFLPAEGASRLRRLSLPQRAEAFFQAWTRMEAGQKASGQGLAPTPEPTTGPCSLQTSQREITEASENAACFAENLAIAGDYAAALAVCGYGYTVRYLDWPGTAHRHAGHHGGKEWQ